MKFKAQVAEPSSANRWSAWAAQTSTGVREWKRRIARLLKSVRSIRIPRRRATSLGQPTPMKLPASPQPRRLDEIWFLTSELEGERASSFRQSRWCQIFMEAGACIGIFNVQGAFALSETHCRNDQEFSEFRRTSLAKSRPVASVREGTLVGLLRWLKHHLLVDLYLPNVVRLVWRCHRKLQHRTCSVAVMASSPPFSMALAGALLKRLHPDTVVLSVDMRDAWALHDALGGWRPLKRSIERWVLRRADYVTTVSFGLAREFEAAYDIRVGVMYNVATHYLDVPPTPTVDLATLNPDVDTTRLKIAYTGSAPAGFYDSVALVSAVKLLREHHPDLADRVQMIFVGACDEIRREAEVQQTAPKDLVFVPMVPHALARSIQVSADALLFLAYYGEGNKGVVSTKLFEYLCLGQPVLPISLHADSDVDRLLMRYCGASINAHSPQEIMLMIARTVREGPATLPRLDDSSRVKELVDDYRRQAQDVLG